MSDQFDQPERPRNGVSWNKSARMWDVVVHGDDVGMYEDERTAYRAVIAYRKEHGTMDDRRHELAKRLDLPDETPEQFWSQHPPRPQTADNQDPPNFHFTREAPMSDQFHQITQNFHATRQDPPMTRQRTPMNAATAIGTLLILLAVLAIIPWGFGADRFLWIAAASGGTGVVLVTIGSIIGRANKEKK